MTIIEPRLQNILREQRKTVKRGDRLEPTKK